MRIANTRVGIVAFLVGTALLFAALILFSKYPTFFSKGKDYQAEFNSVAGLNVGGEVRYGGVLVGTVTALTISLEDPTRILVQFRVKKETPVREDTRASITQVGFLGEQYLNLEPGSRDALPLPEGMTLMSENNLNFQEAMNRVARFLEKTDTLFGGLDRLAKSSPLERIDRTLTRIDFLVQGASSGSERAFARLDEAGRELTVVLQRTERMLASADSAIRVAGPGLTETQREALSTLRETRSLVVELRGALQQGEGVDDLIRNLSDASENLARFSERLDRDPSSILKRREPPKKAVGPTIRD
jgi:phospholipid/cholesterol/gamma-HCH transport system substrate-binding protein